MRFWSRYDHARYVVIPQDYEYLPHGRRKPTPGLAAEFNDHTFDSDDAAQRFRWDSEQTKMVEEYLLSHVDYGKTLRAVTDDRDLNIAPLEIATCLFRVTIDGEVDTCGRPAVSEEGYCAKHLAMIEDAPTPKPNRASKASA